MEVSIKGGGGLFDVIESNRDVIHILVGGNLLDDLIGIGC